MTATRGLEGVVATTSSVSSIIDDVLTYRGYSIDDLADHATFEEVVYLLWNGKLPNERELEQFKAELAEQATVSENLINQLKSLPLKGVHPMAILRTAVSMLGMYDDEAEDMSTKGNYKKR